jgi:hypothetical protein
MGDVEWRGHTIGLVQQKTGNPLTLPLPALLSKRPSMCSTNGPAPPMIRPSPR